MPHKIENGFPLNVATRTCLFGLLDVVRSNPNGAPPNGAPRVDPLTGCGYMTRPALIRKPRDYMIMRGQEHFFAKGNNLTDLRGEKSSEQMCREFPDIRLFGGGIGKGESTRGAWQFTNAMSLDPVDIESVEQTACAFQTRERTNKDGKKDDYEGGNRFASAVIPYGLFLFRGTYIPFVGKENGVSIEDMRMFYESLTECWEHTRSSTRKAVDLRRLYLFEFPNERGTVRETALRQMIKIESKVERPTCFDDYNIELDLSRLPADVTFLAWEDGFVSGREALAAK